MTPLLVGTGNTGKRSSNLCLPFEVLLFVSLIASAPVTASGAGSIGAGGEDLSLGEGIPWSNSGFVDRGSGYDIRSGRIQRTVTDFAVTGSVGARPLVQQRVVYTEALNATYGTAKTVWIMHPFDYVQISPGSSLVRYPSGARMGFGQVNDSVPMYRSKGSSDRAQKDASGNVTDLWLGDGTHVLFANYRASQIIDRNGLVTTLTYGPSGLTQATDSSGRWISYTYYTVPGTSTAKMRQATSSDGQWAQYTWAYLNYQIVLTGVLYSDGTSAAYTYTAMRVPDVFRDTRAQTRLQGVKFSFAGSTVAYGSGMGALYVLSESNPDANVGLTSREPQPGYLYGQRPNILQYQEDSINSSARYEFKGEVLDATVDSVGARVYFDYAINNGEYLNQITDPLGRVTTFDREPVTWRVSKITLPDGSWRQQTFSSTLYPYFIATSRDELGRITTYTRNANGVVNRIDYPDASYETWTNLNAFNQPGDHRLRSGATEKFTYDSAGRLLRHYLPSFTNPHPLTEYTENTYYAAGQVWAGRVATTRDPRGNVTTYEYDLAFVLNSSGQLVQGTTPCAGRGLVTKITNPDSTYRSFGFDKFGNTVWAENELRQRSTTTYDDYQRVLTQKDPLNRTTTYDYTLGQPLSHTENKPSFVTAPSLKKEAFTYDGEFRTMSHTLGFGTADASMTSTLYDLAGNQTSVTDGIGRVTTFTYDNRDRKRFQYAPLGRTTEWQYDAVGNVTKVINPDTTFTTTQYDTMNRVRHNYDELNQHIEYTYHPSGQVNQIFDARGNPYVHAYDASDRIASRTYPGNSTEQWTYDPAGNLSTYTNRSGQILRHYYDNRNREFERDWDSYVAPQVWTQYDAASRVTWKANWHGTLTYGFDAAGQATSEVQKIFGPTTTEDGQTVGVYFGYDADGNRAWYSAPSVYTGYTYNARQQMATVEFGGGWVWASLTYNAAGERVFRNNPNQTRTQYTHDGAGRLTCLNTTRTTDSSNILRQDFGYDARDRRTWTMRDVQYGDTFEYYADSQLKNQRFQVSRPDLNFGNPAAFTDSFNYDPAGNRTSVNENGAVTTYLADATNQYTSVTGKTIQHGDGRGNITQLGVWTFTYDAENRLTQAAKPGRTIRPHYDAQGRLSKIDDTGQFEYRFYHGSQPFLRTRQDWTWIDQIVWGPTPDEVISRYIPGSDWWSNWQFYHQDPLNSTIAVTNASRVVTERYLYDAFGAADIRDGNWNVRTASAIGNRLLFTGQEWWPEMGLHNYKARFYSSDLGRFIQHDPIRFDGGDLNLYRYVSNRPTCIADPSGCIPITDDRLITLNVGGQATLFVPAGPSLVGAGGSINASAGIITNGSLMETRFQITVSISPTVGAGGAAFAGVNVSGGTTTEAPKQGFSSDATFHAEGGLGIAAIANGSVDWKPGESVSVSPPLVAPKFGVGAGFAAYGSVGGTLSATFTTPSIGDMAKGGPPYGNPNDPGNRAPRMTVQEGWAMLQTKWP